MYINNKNKKAYISSHYKLRGLEVKREKKRMGMNGKEVWREE